MNALKYKGEENKVKYIRDGRAPIPDKESTSRVMSSNRGKGTSPEVLIKGELRKRGISGFLSNPKSLPGRPDIYFPKKKLVIFVNGCFWHRCPYCQPSFPKSHSTFWRNKFDRNRERDKKKRNELRTLGRKVIIIWECQLKKNISRQIMRISRALSAS